jgi:hypothetical protein
MSSDADREKWRKEFASWGREMTRMRVGSPMYQMLPEERRREGEVWLIEQDALVEARNKWRFRIMLWWTFVAAVASIIAAFTGIMLWRG